MSKEFNCNHYDFRTANSEKLCYQSLKFTGKKNRKELLDANIAILDDHLRYMRIAMERNRCERVIDHLQALKDDPEAVFDTRMPRRFR